MNIITRVKEKGISYLVVGAWNTAFGYAATVGILYLLRGSSHITVNAMLASVVCISMSFITYKIFVFKTKGQWIREYLKCYVVYGGTSLLGIVGLWWFVDVLSIPIWLSQLILMTFSVVVGFIGHSTFTFNSKENRGA